MAEAFQVIAKKITCPKCKKENSPQNDFCAGCGISLSSSIDKSIENNIDSNDPIAEGLAAWNLEPPQTIVRRKAKK